MSTDPSPPFTSNFIHGAALACSFKFLTTFEIPRELWHKNVLYHHTLPDSLRYGLSTGLLLSLNDTLLHTFPSNAHVGTWDSLRLSCLAGGVAGITTMVLEHPCEQIYLHQFLGIGKINFKRPPLKHSIQQLGVTGLYRHISASLCEAFVYRGVQLGLFNHLQQLNPWYHDLGVYGWMSTFSLAGLSQHAAVTVAYPFTKIRYCLQASFGFLCQPTLYDAIRIRNFRVLYHGSIMTGSIMLMGYDRIKLLMQSHTK